MALINWDDSLSVKINSIDDQHKKLIAMINDFYDGISKRSGQESVLKLILEMKNYTVVHFTNEEKIMRQVNYPDFDSHKKLHENFIAKVVELETKIKSGKLVISLEITTFLKDWLKNHIMVIDKKYSDYFMRKGIN